MLTSNYFSNYNENIILSGLLRVSNSLQFVTKIVSQFSTKKKLSYCKIKPCNGLVYRYDKNRLKNGF